MRWLIIFAAITYNLTLEAQSFVTEATIEFEHKTHVKNLWKEQGMNEQYIRNMSTPWRTSYHNFYFKDSKSLYNSGRDAETPQAGWGELHPQNTIYFNHDSGLYIAQKNFFEQKYLIQDSLPNYQWKITSETRTIAGYTCRKAIGKICDSVVIIAFFAERIMISGGPESFNGLPGMILGVAIPRMHTTWYATKVELKATLSSELKAPTKGKKNKILQMQEEILKAVDDWGDYKHRAVWLSSI